MPHEFETLLHTREGGVATLTLNRPAVLHALNAQMFDELEQAFAQLAADDDVRVIVLTGAGERAFAAGADIRGLGEKNERTGRELSERGHAVFNSIERCGKPVLACINGVALGGGCELALSCTLRLASTSARLGLPEVKLGLIPGYGGTQRLVRLIGRGQALRLLLSGEVVSAERALALGLVEEVHAPEDLLPRVRELAATIAAAAPLAVRAAIEAVNRSEGLALDEGLAVEAEIFGRLCGTADKNEGVDAFLNKRAAQWKGH